MYAVTQEAWNHREQTLQSKSGLPISRGFWLYNTPTETFDLEVRMEIEYTWSWRDSRTTAPTRPKGLALDDSGPGKNMGP